VTLYPILGLEGGQKVAICPRLGWPEKWFRKEQSCYPPAVKAARKCNEGEMQMKFGDRDIQETTFQWEVAPLVPMRKLYALNVGQHVDEAPTTENQHELWVMWDGRPIPAGAALCRELQSDMNWIFFTETWGGQIRFFDAHLFRRPMEEPWQTVMGELIAANGGRIGGLPDVIGQRNDGTVVLCELKARASKDRLQRNQHDFANAAVSALGERVELMVAIWG
jgi:hypothetical protein